MVLGMGPLLFCAGDSHACGSIACFDGAGHGPLEQHSKILLSSICSCPAACEAFSCTDVVLKGLSKQRSTFQYEDNCSMERKWTRHRHHIPFESSTQHLEHLFWNWCCEWWEMIKPMWGKVSKNRHAWILPFGPTSHCDDRTAPHSKMECTCCVRDDADQHYVKRVVFPLAMWNGSSCLCSTCLMCSLFNTNLCAGSLKTEACSIADAWFCITKNMFWSGFLVGHSREKASIVEGSRDTSWFGVPSMESFCFFTTSRFAHKYTNQHQSLSM